MSDLIDKQVVLDTIHLFFTEEIDKIPTKKTEDGEVIIICKAQPLFAMNKTLSRRIKELSSVNPQEPKTDALDKIRTEIEELADADGYGDYQLGFSFGLMMAMEIIDKYRESEVQ